MEIIDKHAPLKSKRASKKNSPWITYELSRKIHKRNYLKRKATLNNDVTTWQQYKHARNGTNNAVRTAKRHYLRWPNTVSLYLCVIHFHFKTTNVWAPKIGEAYD